MPESFLQITPAPHNTSIAQKIFFVNPMEQFFFSAERAKSLVLTADRHNPHSGAGLRDRTHRCKRKCGYTCGYTRARSTKNFFCQPHGAIFFPLEKNSNLKKIQAWKKFKPCAHGKKTTLSMRKMRKKCKKWKKPHKMRKKCKISIMLRHNDEKNA